MKPSSAKPDFLPARAEPPPPATGADEYGADLERVEEIERQQRRLKDLRERAEALRSEVAGGVYRKVVDGYAEQSASLEREAAQIKTRLCDAHRQLQTLFERSSASCEQARFELEELEFRHALGELAQEQLAELRQAPERTLNHGQTELEAIGPVRARFARFFDGVSPEQRAELGASGERAGEAGEEESKSSKANAEPSDRLPLVRVDRTPSAASIGRIASFLERTRMVPGPTDDSDAATFALPIAALIVAGKVDTTPTEYRLRTLNHIGRAEDSAIQITDPSASRRHAAIMATPEGFMVKDLQSQNGTLVNGERIKDRLLIDGDRIQIGEVVFIFRSPWGGRVPR